ncbi:MAG: O-antigen ligase family protein, partial [Gammaproteobacteria bacterium]|nr:O-antigen ligase family protein [Gammaproteobacteria bacterium]
SQKINTAYETKIKIGSVILVIALYPGFFLYNVFLSWNLCPQFAGGWYGPVSLFIGLPYLIYLAVRWINRRGIVDNIFDFFLCTLVIYIFLWALVFHFFGSFYNLSSKEFYSTNEMLLLWLVTYVGFKNFDYSGKISNRILLFSWLFMVIVTFINAKHGMYYAKEQNSVSQGVDIATYQGFSRSALVVSYLLITRFSGYRLACILCLSMLLLFFLGDRTGFIGILLCSIVSYLLGEQSGFKKIRTLIIISAVLGMMGIYYAHIFYESRISSILNISYDASWQERKRLSQFAWETIKQHWLLGDYGSELIIGSGYYAHNWLSAWVAYGFFGFLGFISMNFLSFIYSIKVIVLKKFKCTQLDLFSLGMSLYGIVVMIFSTSIGDPIFSVAWGAAAACVIARM